MTDAAVVAVPRRAHVRAVRSAPAEIATRLQEVLGQDVVAVIVGRSQRSVTRWVAGDAVPAAREERLLRDTYQVVELMTEVEGAEVTRAWFIGMNPQLNDDAPSEVIAAGRVRDVLAAARAFLNAG